MVVVTLLLLLLASPCLGNYKIEFSLYENEKVTAEKHEEILAESLTECAVTCWNAPLNVCDGFHASSNDSGTVCDLLQKSKSIGDENGIVLYMKARKSFMKTNKNIQYHENFLDIHDLLNGIVPEATTPSWPEGCFLDGKDYDWMTNIARMEGIESAVACQKLCQQTVGCEKFTYHYNTETSKNCWLKNGGGLSTLSDVKGTISGPQFCP